MSPLSARKKSFMLLPDFTYQPGREVTLGRVIPYDGDLKIPSPSDPFPFRLEVPEDRVERETLSWPEIDINDIDTKAGWMTAALSCFTGIGGGLKGERQKSKSLRVSSERITRTIIRPTQDDIRRVLSDEDISATLSLMAHPALFLITGLMVAHGAHVEEDSGQQHGGGLNADVDLSAAQVPMNLGAGVAWSKRLDQRTGHDIEGDFILAYQLVRLQRKFLGDVNKIKGRPEIKVALFDDTRSTQAPVYLHDYLEEDVLEALE
jgi:hypothetical protein